jgi:acetyl-CoA carboxylase carboxyl transferase subunit alpha
VPEPLGGRTAGLDATAAAIKEAVGRHLQGLRGLSRTSLLATRYDRLRSFGRFEDRGGIEPGPPSGGVLATV